MEILNSIVCARLFSIHIYARARNVTHTIKDLFWGSSENGKRNVKPNTGTKFVIKLDQYKEDFIGKKTEKSFSILIHLRRIWEIVVFYFCIESIKIDKIYKKNFVLIYPRQ